jgi:hypothetical protein
VELFSITEAVSVDNIVHNCGEPPARDDKATIKFYMELTRIIAIEFDYGSLDSCGDDDLSDN